MTAEATTADLVFYANPMSRARIVRWMLEEVGVPYRTELLDFGAGMKSAAYLAMNPMGKVPTLRHGDVVVTECAAICAYLADAFPQAGLAPPPGDPARGAYYRWLFFGAGPVEAATTNKSLGFVAPAERQGMVGYGCYEDVLKGLDHAVSNGDYLAGDQLQRRRRLSRLADRLGHDVRLDRDASGLSRPMSGASWRGRRRSVPAPSTTRSSRRRKRGTRRRNERHRRAAGVGRASGRGTARRRPVLARDSRIESGLELLQNRGLAGRRAGVRDAEVAGAQVGHEGIPQGPPAGLQDFRADRQGVARRKMSPAPGADLGEDRHQLDGTLGEAVYALLLVGRVRRPADHARFEQALEPVGEDIGRDALLRTRQKLAKMAADRRTSGRAERAGSSDRRGSRGSG